MTTAGTPATVTYPSTSIITSNASYSNGGVTVSTTGTYQLMTNGTINYTGTGNVVIALAVNGNAIYSVTATFATAGEVTGIPVSIAYVANLSANDTVSVTINQPSSTGANDGNASLSLYRIA